MSDSVPTNRLEWSGFRALAPDANAALSALSKAVEESGLPHVLLELIKLRASQINGCAFCVQWHASAARKLGVSEERLQLVASWRHAPVFEQRERAAFAWSEALTLIAENDVDDELYDNVRKHFNERELAALTAAIVMINTWNRIGKAYRFTPMLPK